MAYEVVKEVNGHRYRYRVERTRDPASGKTKARWIYLGRADADAQQRRRNSGQTRDRLIDALASLTERTAFAQITVDAITAQAGVAHGTFYRHFSDRFAVLRAAVERWRAQIERERPSFDGPLGSREDERARVRKWVISVVAGALQAPGLFDAWRRLAEESEPDRHASRARRRAAQAAFAQYLQRLSEARIIATPPQPERFAGALFVMYDGVYRTLGTQGGAASGAGVAEDVADVFDRAIFGPPQDEGGMKVL